MRSRSSTGSSARAAWLVLIWNVRDETVPWVKAMGDLVANLQEHIPRHQDDAWRPAVDDIAVVRASSRQRRSATASACRPTASSTGWRSMSAVAAETPEVRDELMAAVAAILRTDPDTAGRDEIVLPYTTELHWLRRLDAGSPSQEGTNEHDAR